MNTTNRREFLKVGGATIGLMAISGVAASVMSCSKGNVPETKATTPPVVPTPTAYPWPYQKIDPVAAAEAAYTAYYNGGCMYGAFEGIVSQLRAKVGAPYDTFPAAMMKYGGGGVSGWGTLCGALNGAAAAIYLVDDAKVGNPIINQVYGWYGSSLLPDFKPANPKFPDIQTSVAESQLCHVSVSKWSTKTGFKTASAERAERCAWLTASVAKYTVDLLNAQAEGTLKTTFAVPVSVTGCLSCHGKAGPVENVHITNQTVCTDCHTNLGDKHPAK